jgi:hypothetical protein
MLFFSAQLAATPLAAAGGYSIRQPAVKPSIGPGKFLSDVVMIDITVVVSQLVQQHTLVAIRRQNYSVSGNHTSELRHILGYRKVKP